MKQKIITNDDIAIWHDDDSPIELHINEWISPSIRYYLEFGIRAAYSKKLNNLNIFVPFDLRIDEIEDLSGNFNNSAFARGLFNETCTIDYVDDLPFVLVQYNDRNQYVLRLSSILSIKRIKISGSACLGTLITIDISQLHSSLVKNSLSLGGDIYIRLRVPHKSIEKKFLSHIDTATQIKSLFDSPVFTMQCDYYIKINETRALPALLKTDNGYKEQIISKSIFCLVISDQYDVDGDIYKTRLLEKELFTSLYLPVGFCNNTEYLVYQLKRNRPNEKEASFHLRIENEKIFKTTLTVYALIVVILSTLGSALWTFLSKLIGIE